MRHSKGNNVNSTHGKKKRCARAMDFNGKCPRQLCLDMALLTQSSIFVKQL